MPHPRVGVTSWPTRRLGCGRSDRPPTHHPHRVNGDEAGDPTPLGGFATRPVAGCFQIRRSSSGAHPPRTPRSTHRPRSPPRSERPTTGAATPNHQSEPTPRSPAHPPRPRADREHPLSLIHLDNDVAGGAGVRAFEHAIILPYGCSIASWLTRASKRSAADRHRMLAASAHCDDQRRTDGKGPPTTPRHHRRTRVMPARVPAVVSTKEIRRNF